MQNLKFQHFFNSILSATDQNLSATITIFSWKTKKSWLPQQAQRVADRPWLDENHHENHSRQSHDCEIVALSATKSWMCKPEFMGRHPRYNGWKSVIAKVCPARFFVHYIRYPVYRDSLYRGFTVLSRQGWYFVCHWSCVGCFIEWH